MPTNYRYVRVDRSGNPLDPLPAGYKFMGYFNPYPGGGQRREAHIPPYYQQQQQSQAPAEGEWDYTNPPLDASGRPMGPQGEKLPYGAERFDPWGRPYYGGGLPGWWKGVWSRLTDPTVSVSPGAAEWKRLFTEGAASPNAPPALRFLQNALKGVELGGQELEAGGAEPGARPLITTYLGRGVSEAIKAILAGAGAVAEQTERFVGGAAMGLSEIGNLGEMPAPPEYGDWRDFFIQANPLVMGYNALRATTAPASLQTKQDIMERSMNAGRIAYSAYFDPTVRQEFARRFEAGEDPYLLAMELQNPWVELGGQMIFDPLNVIGAFAGKAAKASKFAKDADVMLKVVDPNVARVLNTFGDVAGDARAGEALQALADADKAALAARRTRLAAQAEDFSPWALTAAGKRYVLSHNTGTLATWVAHNSGPEEAAELFRAMAMAGSSDADEAATGLSVMARFKYPQPLFSEAGYQTRILLRDLMTFDGEFAPEKFLKTFEKLDNPAEIAEVMGKKLQGVADGLFPTISEARKAAEAGKGGELADWYDHLSPVVKAVARFGEAAEGVTGPVNRFFAGLYMGMSPGYAFRNALNDTFTTFVDLGPKAAVEAAGMSLAQTFAPGRAVARAQEKMARLLGGVTPKGASLGYGPVASLAARPQKGIFATFLRVSENIEKGVSTVIAANVVEDTMRKMLRPGRALPDIASLVQAGMKPELAETLGRFVVANYGDVKAARKAFMAAAGTGRLDVVKMLSAWATPDDLKALQKLGFLDEVEAVIARAKDAGDDAEAAIAEIKALSRAMLDKANEVAGETPGILPEMLPEAAETMRDLENVVKSGNMTDEAADLLQRQMVANSMTFRAYEDAFTDIITSAALPETLRQAVRQARDMMNGLLDETRRKNDAFVHSVWDWNDRIKAYVKQGVDWEERANRLGINRAKYAIKDERSFYMALWKEVGLPGEEGDIVNALFANPDVLSGKINVRKAFLDQMWDSWFRPTRSQAWAEARDEYARIVDGLFSQIEGAGDLKVAKRKSVLAARKNLETARQFDNAEPLGNGIFVPAGGGDALVTPYVPGTAPTLPRVYYEQREAIGQLFDRLAQGVQDNWMRQDPVEFEPGLRNALDAWLKDADGRIAKARLTATAVADAAREFALLDYNKKRYFDLAGAFIFPYHFWYNRTYAHWMQRLAFNPEIVAAYARYKQHLEKIHAGMPEWWKYNVNTNELFGLASEHPLFFNLEASLNPLNGLTGVDFTDPYKRVDWWTMALDDIAKFGPSVWTPIQLATAVSLTARGESEAAARWAGRLIPQTTAIKSAAALLNLGAPDLDPAVFLFSGGLDPYERRRVGRALGAMIQDGQASEAEALDAARTQSGALWDAAVERAARERAPGNLASFMLGVGFKPRSQQDIDTDRMYQAYNALWAMEPNLSPEEFRQAMEGLRTEYPFMDAVLMSRKGGDARDRSYAYSVMARIPPGQKTDVAKAAGIDPRLMDKFYAGKGHVEDWPETERARFMAGIVTIGALLDVPDSATRQEWAEATGIYSRIMREGEVLFGADIWQRVDTYFAAKGSTFADREAAESILAADPEIEAALDWKSNQILTDPLLSAYYGGVEDLRAWYKGQMYDQIESELGPGVSALWSEYFLLKNTGREEERKAFWKAHETTLKRYLEIRDAYAPLVNQEVMKFAGHLPQALPAEVRGEADLSTIMAQDVLGAITPKMPEFQWGEWQTVLSEPLQDVLVTSFLGGEELPAEAQMELEYLAGQMGLPVDQLLQMIQASIANQS